MRIVQFCCVVLALSLTNTVFAQRCFRCNRRAVCCQTVPAASNVGYGSPVAQANYGTPVYSGPAYASTIGYEQPVYDQVTSPAPSYSTAEYEVASPVVSGGMMETPIYGSPNGVTVASVSYSPVVNTGTATGANFYSMPMMGSGDAITVLAIVNQKRRRAGLYELTFDPNLASMAQRKSSNRASRRMTGHDGSQLGGARVEGVGYSYGQANPANGFNACYLYSTGYRYAGAAIARDANGQAYYTLLLR